MIKITLILLIVAIVTRAILILLGKSMSPEEQAAYVFTNEMPFRITITTCIFILSVIGFIICAVSTIILW